MKVEFSRVFTLLLLITLLLVSMIVISFKEFRKKIGNHVLMVIVSSLVTILNLYSYYQNPTRLSNESKMYGKHNITYRKLNVYAAIGSLTFDCISLFNLSRKFTSSYSYISIIVALIYGLGQMFIWIVYYAEAPIFEHNYTFLPSILLCKKSRIALNSSILALDIFKGWQEFIDDDEISPITSGYSFIYRRFGGWGTTNKDHLLYLFGLGGAIGSIILDIISLDATITYKPSDYNMPEQVQ